MLYSGGKRVCIENMIVCVHVCISCSYDLMFVFAMLMSLCVDVMEISSAHVVSFTGARGVVRVSDVYMLNNVGDRTPPCGTSVLNWRCAYNCFVSECSVCFASFDVVCELFENRMYVMFVCCSSRVSE